MFKSNNCQGCGQQLSATDTVCPECGKSVPKNEETDSLEAWEANYKRIRFHWVITVVMFWTTAGITAGLYLIQGRAYINELVFIAAIFIGSNVIFTSELISELLRVWSLLISAIMYIFVLFYTFITIE